MNEDDFSIALDLILKLSEVLTDKEVTDRLIGLGINQKEVKAYCAFIPIATCRQLLPKVNFPKNYIEDSIEKEYSLNKFYMFVSAEIKKITIELSSEEIVKIASRSAEFKVINQLLLEGGKLEEIELSPVVLF